MSDYSDTFGGEREPWRDPLGALRLTVAGESATPWQVERARAECEALVRVLNEHPPADQGKSQSADNGDESDVVCGNCGCGIGIDDGMVERGARALAGRRYGLRSADTDNPRDYRDARAVLEAALWGEA